MTDRRLLDPLWLSLGTLTALPVPPPARVDRRAAGQAMTLAPVTALVPAVAAAAAAGLARAADLAPLPAAGLAVAALALITRGLHLDGLADTADGLTASYDRDRALQVMSASDTGPAGAAALTLVLLLQAALAAELLAGPTAAGPVAVLVAVVVSRGMLPLACLAAVPSARAQGLGATVAGSVAAGPAAVGLAGLTVCAAAATYADGLSWWRGPLAVVAAAGVTAVMLHRAVRRLGGITGDVLGAIVELGLAAALLALAVG